MNFSIPKFRIVGFCSTEFDFGNFVLVLHYTFLWRDDLNLDKFVTPTTFLGFENSLDQPTKDTSLWWLDFPLICLSQFDSSLIKNYLFTMRFKWLNAGIGGDILDTYSIKVCIFGGRFAIQIYNSLETCN